MLLFLLTEFAWAGKPRTFGLKTGKSLFDIKNKDLLETRISSALDPIGLNVQIVPHNYDENALNVKDISPLDRAGAFYKNKNKDIECEQAQASNYYDDLESATISPWYASVLREK